MVMRIARKCKLFHKSFGDYCPYGGPHALPLARCSPYDEAMQSSARDVNSYLDEVPADRREALEKIRDMIFRTHEGYLESM